jgi:hypothetical protein
LRKLIKQKGGHMNSITQLLDLEDSDIIISDIQMQIATHNGRFCGAKRSRCGASGRT